MFKKRNFKLVSVFAVLTVLTGCSNFSVSETISDVSNTVSAYNPFASSSCEKLEHCDMIEERVGDKEWHEGLRAALKSAFKKMELSNTSESISDTYDPFEVTRKNNDPKFDIIPKIEDYRTDN